MASPTSRLVCVMGMLCVSAQDELSEVEPKAAVQEFQATASPKKAGVQKQLCASQEQHSHGEQNSSVNRVAAQGLDFFSRIALSVAGTEVQSHAYMYACI